MPNLETSVNVNGIATASLSITHNSSVPVFGSYASIDYARAIEDTLAIVLPDDDDELNQILLMAMPYIESKRYQGHRRTSGQTTQWPRNLVYAGDYLVSNEEIPDAIKRAQVAAAAMIYSGVDLSPNIAGQLVIEKTVGPITTKYSDEYLATYDGRTCFSSIDIFLNPFCIINTYRLNPAFGF